MAKRFKIPAIPKGEVARYIDNPYETNLGWGYTGRDGASAADLFVRPNDELFDTEGRS